MKYFSGVVEAHNKKTDQALDEYSTVVDDLKNLLPSLYSVRY